MSQKAKIIICSILLFLLLLSLGVIVAIQYMAQNILKEATPDYPNTSFPNGEIEKLEEIKKANQEAKAKNPPENLEEKEIYQKRLEKLDEELENLAKSAR